MPIKAEKPNLLIGNLSGLIFVVLGFLLAASAYRAASTGYMAAGIVLIAIGVALMVRKIVRRNQTNQPCGFILCTLALLWLAFVVRNDWSAVPVLFGLVLFGIGQGSLVTLLFNVLVTASPKELAGDVGSLRGTTRNLAAAVGTAVAGALLVGLLSAAVLSRIAANPLLPEEIQSQVDLDNLTFVSNDRLESTMARTDATPEQIAEAVRVNTEARLRALKLGLLIMAGLALLAIIPAGRLPNYRPGEIPADPPPTGKSNA